MESPELDAEIWSRLPPRVLLYEIVPRLSVLYRLPLRLVCTEWNTLLLSKSYWDHCNAISMSAFMARVDFSFENESQRTAISISMYDLFRHSWQRLCLIRHYFKPLLYPEGDRDEYELSILSKFAYNEPLASAEDLVCFRVVDPEWHMKGELKKTKLAVGNPVLNKWVILPEISLDSNSEAPPISVSLYLKEDQGFIVIVRDRRSYLFDSSIRCWLKTPFSGHDWCLTRGAVLIDGMVYVLALVEGGNLVLLKYKIDQGEIFRSAPLDACLAQKFRLDSYLHVLELNGQVAILGLENKTYTPHLCIFDIKGLNWIGVMEERLVVTLGKDVGRLLSNTYPILFL